MLDYVGRYTHRVAISNNRILDIENGHVSFRWKDYRNGDAQKIMTLEACEFIRRFLLHVLPPGLQRIRYYGFLGNRHRQEKLDQCRELLNMEVEAPEETDSGPSGDYRDQHEALTGESLHECPLCHRGRMVVVGEVNPQKNPAPPLAPDTS